MATKTSKTTTQSKPRTSKKSPAVTGRLLEVAAAVPRAASAADIELAVAAARAALAVELLPVLHAKYGSPTIPEGADASDYTIDARCLEEYTAARTSRALQILADRGLEVPQAKRAFNISLNATTHEEEKAMSKTVNEEKAAEKAKAAAKSEEKSKVDRVETPHGSFIKGSVLHAIYRCFDLKGGATKAEILERLDKEFCTGLSEADREKQLNAFKTTIGCQIWGMPKNREFKLGRSEEGRYGLHIDGWYEGRVLTPEQKKAAAEKEKAKAEREAKRAEKKAAAEAKLKEKADKAAAKAKETADKAAKAAAEAAKVQPVVGQVVGKVKMNKKK